MTQKEQALVQTINAKLDRIHEEVPGNFVGRMNPRAVEADMERAVCMIRFESQEWMRNPYHSVHGGLLASMADIAMCAVGRGLVEKIGPTLQMSVDFMRPVPVGAVVMVRVHWKKVGRKILFLECHGFTEEDLNKPFFSSSATLMNDSPER